MPKIKSLLIPEETIINKILLIKGKKVILAPDIAELYGVDTKRLNEQVKRNKERFPEDFMFQLTTQETGEVVANCDHLVKLKFSPTLPYAFTQEGVAMLSAVLKSQRAVEVSIAIVRVFVKLREIILTNSELSKKIDKMENKFKEHDEKFKAIFKTIKKLTTISKDDYCGNKIGFQSKKS